MSDNDFKQAVKEAPRSFDTFEQAAEWCKENPEFIPCDRGMNWWPRFTVTLIPQLGEKVSSYFNGDRYPEGEIIRISKGPMYRRIETSTGRVFWRRRLRGAWVAEGTWSMIPGHHNTRNPSF